FRQETPPPQMLLALTGLACGVTGTALLLAPGTYADASRFRLAGLLLYQGLLLPPVLGIGSFVFPRMLGGDFGEPQTAGSRRVTLLRTLATALLIVASFFLEARGAVILGYSLRALVSAGYLFTEIRWRRAASDAPRGSL